MNKSRAMFFSAVLLTVAFAGTAMAGTSVSFMAAGHTSEQSAVFASFLAYVPNEDPSMSIDSAISVSNILGAPAGIDAAGGAYEGSDMMGSVEIHLYGMGMDEPVMYSTDMMMAGTGTNMDGDLMAGGTYTVFLSQILMAAGHEGHFLGYAWIVGNFDGIAGTRVVIDGSGMFSQGGDLSPGVDHNGGGIKTMMMMDMDMDDMDMDDMDMDDMDME